MIRALADTARTTDVAHLHTTLRRVSFFDCNPAGTFDMVAQYFTQAAHVIEVAKQAGGKVSPEQALEAAAVQLSCQLELDPGCMSRVKAALLQAERVLDWQC